MSFGGAKVQKIMEEVKERKLTSICISADKQTSRPWTTRNNNKGRARAPKKGKPTSCLFAGAPCCLSPLSRFRFLFLFRFRCPTIGQMPCQQRRGQEKHTEGRTEKWKPVPQPPVGNCQLKE